ncbi:hypothetical protein HZ326_16513 [Fusarium oxysporum f. sp. albedinis]|nr:hypothetical protein HZ326_16513 [Fusarium oxysporum f. sp. albedinis]
MGLKDLSKDLALIFFLQPTLKATLSPTPAARLNYLLRSNCPIAILRRSLQPPRPNKPYLTEDHNIIQIIKRALLSAKQSNCNKLYIIAAKIRLYLYIPRISKAFLNTKIESLKTLR